MATVGSAALVAQLPPVATRAMAAQVGPVEQGVTVAAASRLSRTRPVAMAVPAEPALAVVPAVRCLGQPDPQATPALEHRAVPVAMGDYPRAQSPVEMQGPAAPEATAMSADPSGLSPAVSLAMARTAVQVVPVARQPPA